MKKKKSSKVKKKKVQKELKMNEINTNNKESSDEKKTSKENINSKLISFEMFTDKEQAKLIVDKLYLLIMDCVRISMRNDEMYNFTKWANIKSVIWSIKYCIGGSIDWQVTIGAMEAFAIITKTKMDDMLFISKKIKERGMEEEMKKLKKSIIDEWGRLLEIIKLSKIKHIVTLIHGSDYGKSPYYEYTQQVTKKTPKKDHKLLLQRLIGKTLKIDEKKNK